MAENKQTSNISNNEYDELIKKNFGLKKNTEKSIVSGKVVFVDKENVIVDVGLKVRVEFHYLNFLDLGKIMNFMLVMILKYL